MLEMLTVHETKRARHEYIQWRSSIQSSQPPNTTLDHTQNYGIKIAQRPHKQGVAITSLTAKSGSLAGLISAICKFSAEADATASTSTATHQVSGTYDLSSPWFPRKYNKLDLWWSYRLTIPPFNEFYERETRTIWCKTVEDHQKSKWKGYGSCVLFLSIPRGMGFTVCLPPHSKALSDITKQFVT